MNYLRLARFDHWFKNLFMLPGVALAVLLIGLPLDQALVPTLIALLSTGFIASANYVINEWLDAEFDRHHPLKKNRPSALGRIKRRFVYLEYSIFAALGLGLAALLTGEFVFFSVLLLIMGGYTTCNPSALRTGCFSMCSANRSTIRCAFCWGGLRWRVAYFHRPVYCSPTGWVGPF